MPNLLTFLRLAASFVFLYFGLTQQWKIAFLLFFVAALTDMVDGFMARLLRQRTELGAFLDPMADKLLMVFGFVVIALGGFIPWILTALVTARDLLIVTGVWFLKRRGIPIVYRPTYLSKATTFFQIVTLVMALYRSQAGHEFFVTEPGRLFLRFFPVILVTTALFTFVTGIQYLRIGRRMLHAHTRP